MATLYSRRAMRHVETGARPLTWADIEREREERDRQMPSGFTFALAFAAVCGFAIGVALVLLATGQ